MSKRYRKSNDDMGCIVWLILAAFALPIVGLCILLEGNDEEKAVGLVLFVIGIIIWAAAGTM